MPAQRTSKGCVDKQRSEIIWASKCSARSKVMVGSHGLCLFRAWSTGTTEKPAFLRPKLSLAEPAQSSKAIGLSNESESEADNGKGNDTECEETSEISLKNLFTGTFVEVQKFSPLTGRTDTLALQGVSALARVCMDKSSDEWHSNVDSRLTSFRTELGTGSMEEFAESLEGNEVASQAAWVAEIGSVLCFFAFLGQD
jgi:hypothetical protein